MNNPVGHIITVMWCIAIGGFILSTAGVLIYYVILVNAAALRKRKQKEIQKFHNFLTLPSLRADKPTDETCPKVGQPTKPV
jgi:hypothetical protein